MQRKTNSTNKEDARLIGEEEASTRSSNNLIISNNQMNWKVPLRNANQRMRRIEEILDSIPYFFDSMLDDCELQTQLLADPGDCFLISCPKSKELNSNSIWYLVVLKPNEIVHKIKVIYLNKTLKIWSEKSTTLFGYVKKHLLQTIERPWNIQPEQITSKMAIVPQQAFPINNAIFPLGTLSQKTMHFDSKRWIPVIELCITECTEQELQCLVSEAEKRRRFGSIRIWRLWGVCRYEAEKISLILEDIIYGSVAEFVRTNFRPQAQLCKFAVQLVEGLRHLEKYGFVHRRLSIDVCLLTYNYNLKIAIYGLTPNELYLQHDEFDDVDHYRWIPPECLPGLHDSPAAYNSSGMIYSFGMILWSMFHYAALPYEDEPAEKIRNREYRIQYQPYIDEDLVPKEIRNVILSCWSEEVNIRGRLKNIKIYLRKQYASCI